jgi:hypothetical protein
MDKDEMGKALDVEKVSMPVEYDEAEKKMDTRSMKTGPKKMPTTGRKGEMASDDLADL